MAGYLAYIIPVDPGARPEHPIVKPPPGQGPGGPWVPSHPIVIPEPPGGGEPPQVTHPIVIPEPPDGGPPIVILPPTDAHPEHPIVLPLPPIEDLPHPEHPIILPKPPGVPPGIWGPGDGFPTPPIVIPPEEKPDRPKLINWGTVWTPQNGWQVIGVPNVPHPAPSKK